MQGIEEELDERLAKLRVQILTDTAMASDSTEMTTGAEEERVVCPECGKALIAAFPANRRFQVNSEAIDRGREPAYEIPSGENLEQLSQRGMRILEQLAQRHPGERVALVSHGALLTTLLRKIQGIALHLPSQFTVRNGSISCVQYEDTPGHGRCLA